MGSFKEYAEDRLSDHVKGNYDFRDYEYWNAVAKACYAEAVEDTTEPVGTFTHYERARLALIKRLQTHIDDTVAELGLPSSSWVEDVIEAAFQEINPYDIATGLLEEYFEPNETT